MFGTVARVQVQPDKVEEFTQIGEQWSRDHSATSGETASYIFKLEKQPNEYLIVAIFPDRDTYFRNAEDPETDRWYRKMRETLVADPEWNDGEVRQLPVLSGI